MFSHRYWNWASVQISEYLFGGGGWVGNGVGGGLVSSSKLHTLGKGSYISSQLTDTQLIRPGFWQLCFVLNKISAVIFCFFYDKIKKPITVLAVDFQPIRKGKTILFPNFPSNKTLINALEAWKNILKGNVRH